MAKSKRAAIPQPSVTEYQRKIVLEKAAELEWSVSHLLRSALVKLIQDAAEDLSEIIRAVERNLVTTDTIIIHNTYVSPETRINLDLLRAKIGKELGKKITISAMVRAAIDNFCLPF